MSSGALKVREMDAGLSLSVLPAIYLSPDMHSIRRCEMYRVSESRQEWAKLHVFHKASVQKTRNLALPPPKNG